MPAASGVGERRQAGHDAYAGDATNKALNAIDATDTLAKVTYRLLKTCDQIATMPTNIDRAASVAAS